MELTLELKSRLILGLKAGVVLLNVGWKLFIIRLAPLILGVAVAICIWHWGFGRIDI